MQSAFQKAPSLPQEGFVPVDETRLYTRQVGDGQAIFILHDRSAVLLNSSFMHYDTMTSIRRHVTLIRRQEKLHDRDAAGVEKR